MSVTWGNPRSQQRRHDLAVDELLNKPRSWERQNPSGLTRGIRNGFLFVTPFWLAFGRLMNWW